MKTKSLFILILILITLTSCKSQIASQTSAITKDTDPWEYYCNHYLHINPKNATPEQENYYLDVFMETDEYYDLFIIPFENQY